MLLKFSPAQAPGQARRVFSLATSQSGDVSYPEDRRIPTPPLGPGGLMRTVVTPRWLTRVRRGILLLAGLAAAVPAYGQEARTFTPPNALEVRLVSVADATLDVGRVAVTVTTAASRTDTDHFRFGDPTYLAPLHMEFEVLDVEDGRTWRPFEPPVHVVRASWSPDGDRLAVLRHDLDDGTLHLEILDPSAEGVRRVAPSPSWSLSSGSPLEWLPDGSGIVLGVRTSGWAEAARTAFLELSEGPVVVQDGSEDFLAWEAVRNRGSLEELVLLTLADESMRTLDEEGARAEVRVAPDGSHVTFTRITPLRTSYERGKGTEFEVVRLGLAEGEETVTLLEATEDRIRPDFSPDGQVMAWADGGDVFVQPMGADSATNLTEDHRPELFGDEDTERSYSLERWRPDSGALLARAQDGFFLLDPAGGEPERIWAFPDDEDEREAMPRRSVVQWTEDGDVLYLSHAARDRWERGLVRYDISERAQTVLVADSDLYRDWRVAEDGSRIVVRRSDGDRPDELWTAGGAFSDARPLTDLNPWLDEVALSRSELIRYLDVDGEELYGILHYPPDYEEGTAYPLVAEIYESFFDNGWNYSVQNLAAQGWFVLRPSVRLEEGFPGEGWMKGVTTAINGLIEGGMVDGDRLGVHGTSYGGYATNLLITQTDRFAAAINISGKVNIISFLGDSEKITTRNYAAAEVGQDRIGATLWEQPQKYWQHSAVMFADRIETPLLLLTGEGDWNVPAGNTREMYYALRRLGKEVVWVNYMNAGHGAGRAGSEEDFLDHWDRIIGWYTRHFDTPDDARADELDGADR